MSRVGSPSANHWDHLLPQRPREPLYIVSMCDLILGHLKGAFTPGSMGDVPKQRGRFSSFGSVRLDIYGHDKRSPMQMHNAKHD